MEKSTKNWLWAIMLAFVLPFTFVSCGGDDDDDDDDNNNGGSYASLIVGTWSDTGDDDWSYNSYDGDANGFKFYSNGKFIYYGSYQERGTYRLDGNMLLLKYDDGGIEEYRIYQLTKYKLVMMYIDNTGYEDEEPETYYRVD